MEGNGSNGSDDEYDYSDMPELISFTDLKLEDDFDRDILEDESLVFISSASKKSTSCYNLSMNSDMTIDPDEPPRKKRCSSEPIMKSNKKNSSSRSSRCSSSSSRTSSRNSSRTSSISSDNNVDLRTELCNDNYESFKYYENNHKLERYDCYNDILLESNYNLFYNNELSLSKEERVKILEQLCNIYHMNSLICPVRYCKCK